MNKNNKFYLYPLKLRGRVLLKQVEQRRKEKKQEQTMTTMKRTRIHEPVDYASMLCWDVIVDHILSFVEMKFLILKYTPSSNFDSRRFQTESHYPLCITKQVKELYGYYKFHPHQLIRLLYKNLVYNTHLYKMENGSLNIPKGLHSFSIKCYIVTSPDQYGWKKRINREKRLIPWKRLFVNYQGGKHQHLKKLTLNGFRFLKNKIFNRHHISSEEIRKRTQTINSHSLKYQPSFIHVEYLTIMNCGDISSVLSNPKRQIREELKNLKYLYIEYQNKLCGNTGGGGKTYPIHTFEKLTKLIFNGNTSDDDYGLNCPNLKHLELLQSQNVNILTRKTALFTYLETLILYKIDISYYLSFPGQCSQNPHYFLLSWTLLKLTTLEIIDCREVNDFLFESNGNTVNNFANLKILILTNNKSIRGLRWQVLPKLECFVMNKCKEMTHLRENYTITVFENNFAKFPKLKYLFIINTSLYGLPKVPDHIEFIYYGRSSSNVKISGVMFDFMMTQLMGNKNPIPTMSEMDVKRFKQYCAKPPEPKINERLKRNFTWSYGRQSFIYYYHRMDFKCSLPLIDRIENKDELENHLYKLISIYNEVKLTHRIQKIVKLFNTSTIDLYLSQLHQEPNHDF